MKKMAIAVGLGAVLLVGLFMMMGSLIAGGSDDDCDSSDDTATDTAAVSGDEAARAKIVYDELIAKGASDAGASEYLGVWEFESHFNPSVANGAGSGATGLAQWMGTRLTNLQSYASEHDEQWDDLKTQTDFALYEISTSYKSSAKYLVDQSVSEDGVKGILDDYEGLSKSPEQYFLSTRLGYAESWYAKFSDGTHSGNLTSLVSGADASTGGVDMSTDDSDDDSCSSSTSSLNITGDKTAYFDDIEQYLTEYIGADSHSSKSVYNFGGDPNNLNKEQGTEANGTDCSGFTIWVLQHAGITGLPRTSQAMWQSAVDPIAESDAKAGDLVFFEGTSSPNHVGIYIGNGEMIDDQDNGIVKEKVHASWWPNLQFGRLKDQYIPEQYK